MKSLILCALIALSSICAQSQTKPQINILYQKTFQQSKIVYSVLKPFVKYDKITWTKYIENDTTFVVKYYSSIGGRPIVDRYRVTKSNNNYDYLEILDEKPFYTILYIRFTDNDVTLYNDDITTSYFDAVRSCGDGEDLRR